MSTARVVTYNDIQDVDGETATSLDLQSATIEHLYLQMAVQCKVRVCVCTYVCVIDYTEWCAEFQFTDSMFIVAESMHPSRQQRGLISMSIVRVIGEHSNGH